MKFFIVALALVAASVSAQEPIPILRQASDISPEGSYSYNYETGHGIAAGEQGQIRATGPETADKTVQGNYQYTAPDGTPIAVTYVADANGFQPQGDHLPVAPPVPEAILRAIEYNLAHAQQHQGFHRK